MDGEDFPSIQCDRNPSKIGQNDYYLSRLQEQCLSAEGKLSGKSLSSEKPKQICKVPKTIGGKDKKNYSGLMATKLIQPPKSAPHLLHPMASGTMKIMRVHRAFSATRSMNKIYTKQKQYPLVGLQTIALAKASEQSFGVEVESEEQTVQQIKASLYDALQGINRGIFGVQSEKKAKIEKMVKLLESQNPSPEPTTNLEKMAGTWKLVYSTIAILGSKRTKLGLRDFISLGEFYQNIDVIERKAVNVIEFSARGLNLFKGQLRIEAAFKIASKSRVDIVYESSTISPEQLMNLFEKNFDLLLSIFNPEGWLNITYVDDNFRIGRDDKGNIFVLERLEKEQSLNI